MGRGNAGVLPRSRTMTTVVCLHLSRVSHPVPASSFRRTAAPRRRATRPWRTWSDGTSGPAGDPVLDELETPAGRVQVTRHDFDEHGWLRSIDATNPALDWLPEAERTVRTQLRYDPVGRIVEETTTVGT